MLIMTIIACAASRPDDTASAASLTGNPCIDDFADAADHGSTPLDPLTPVVVCTWPRSGDTAVDPALASITVRFSHAMAPDGWSWVGQDGLRSPVTTGNPAWLDAHTQQLPVQLDPQASYGVWINSDAATAFRSEAGESALPYALWFRTAP